MWEKLLAIFKTLNVDIAGKENEIKAILESERSETTKTIEQLKNEIEALKKNNPAASLEIDAVKKELSDTRTLLSDVKKQYEDQLKAAKDKLEADVKAKRVELIAQALKDGKVIESTKGTFEKLVESNYDAASEWLTTAPVHPEFKKPGDTPPDKKSAIRGPLSSADATILKSMNQMDGSAT